MDTAYSPDDLAFRDEVRDFFQEAYTPELRQRMRSSHKEGAEEWQRKLNDKGWVTGRSSSAGQAGRPRRSTFMKPNALWRASPM